MSDCLAGIHVFAGVAAEARQTLASHARISRLATGEEKIVGGLVVVLAGTLECDGEVLSTGDTSYEFGSPITVRAQSSAEVATFEWDRLHAFFAGDPEAKAAVDQALERQRLREALRRSEWASSFEKSFAADLENAFETVQQPGGELLFAEGDAGDSLYAVLHGRLRVTARGHDGEERAVQELGPGEMVGEMALISGQPRTASVWTVRDSHLARLPREAFNRLVSRHPEEAMRVFAGKVAERLREANRGRGDKSTGIRTLGIVPLDDSLDINDIASRLARGFEKIGRTALAGHDEGPIWRHRLERDHDFVLYQATGHGNDWSARCLRQSDHILLVGRAGAPSCHSEVETWIGRMPAKTRPRRSLLLVRDGCRFAQGTKAWSEGREIDRILQADASTQADFDRVARFLANRAIGLALGGGFARGLAHVGVLEALEQAGLPVDAIGGASMGAVVGGLWAQGWSRERIIHEIREGCRDSLNDMTLPFLAFKRGGKFSRLIVDFFEDRQIEDLPVPYFCVSANLNRAEVKMHDSGGLAKAVLASTRAPAIFPPIVYDGELHVDGGLINNVPVDLMRPFSNNGLVIGVDVSPPHELTNVQDYGYDVSGWDAVRSRFGVLGKERDYLPSLLLVLMRTIEFGGIAFKTERTRMADLYLQPPLLGFKRTDWHHAETIVERTRQYTLEQLPLLKHREEAK